VHIPTFGVGGTSFREVTKLKKQIHDLSALLENDGAKIKADYQVIIGNLEKECDEKDRQITSLNDAIEDQKRHLNDTIEDQKRTLKGLEQQIAAAKEYQKHMATAHELQIAAAKEHQQHMAAAHEKQLAALEDKHKALAEKMVSEHKELAEKMASEHEAKVTEILERSSQGLEANEPVLEKVRAEARALANELSNRELENVKKEHRRALEDVNEEHSRMLEKLNEQNRRMMKEADEKASQIRRREYELDAALTKQRELQNDLEISLRAATDHQLRANAADSEVDRWKKQVEDRNNRAEVHRIDYMTYRDVAREHGGKVKETLTATTTDCDCIEDLARVWRMSAARFQDSPVLEFFRQDSKYAGLYKSICNFQDDQARSVSSAASELRKMRDELADERLAGGLVGHASRLLTKFVHYEDERTLSEAVFTHGTVLWVYPLRRRQEKVSVAISRLFNQMDSYRERSKRIPVELRNSIAHLRGTYAHLRKVNKWVVATRRRQVLQMLLHSSPLDRQVYVAIHNFYQRLDRIKAALPDRNSNDVEFVKTMRQDSNEVRVRIDKYKADYRDQLVREAMTGNIHDIEIENCDRRIRDLLEQAQREEDTSLDQMVLVTQAIRPVRAAPSTIIRPVPRTSSRRVRKRLTPPPRANNGLGFSPSAPRQAIHALPPYVHVTQPTRGFAHSATARDWSPLRSDSEADVEIDHVDNPVPVQGELSGMGTKIEDESPDAGTERVPGSRPVMTHTDGSDEAPSLQSTTSTSSVAANDSHTPATMGSGAAPEDSAAVEGGEGQQTLIPNDASSPEQEPETVLQYQIPAEAYRDAVLASQKSNAAYWSHNLYKSPEGKPVMLFYCKTLETAERQCKLFLNEPVLGFDLEWESHAKLGKSSIKQNVSLIQIAAEDKILLIHVACFPGETVEQLLPPSLKTILESPEIAKAGVNVSGDANRMRICFGVDMRGVFELSHMYRVVRYGATRPKHVSFRLTKLADQVQDVLLLPLLKNEVRTSAWSKPLNGQQSAYAATDAYAGFRLYHQLDNERKRMRPTPPRPAFYETGRPLVLGNGELVERSKYKPRAVPKMAAVANVENEEEFFDALPEAPDPYDLGANATVARSADAVVDKTAGSDYSGYPDLSEAVEAAKAGADAPAAAVSALATVRPLRADAAQLPKRPASTPSSAPTCEENLLADEWVATYLSAGKAKVGQATLRAYHLWHHQGLDVSKVAVLCRQPPLAPTTVASYVMQAIKEEGLEYDKARVRAALQCLPKSVWPVYARWVKEADFSD
jgi:hypothetical protein